MEQRLQRARQSEGKTDRASHAEPFEALLPKARFCLRRLDLRCESANLLIAPAAFLRQIAQFLFMATADFVSQLLCNGQLFDSHRDLVSGQDEFIAVTVRAPIGNSLLPQRYR